MKRQRKLNFRSVGVKLFVILFCTIVLLSSVLGLTSYYAAKSIITNEVAAASSQSIVQAADKLDFLFAEYEALSRQFAVDSALKSDMETIHNPGAGTVAKVAAEDRIRRKLDSVRGSDERSWASGWSQEAWWMLSPTNQQASAACAVMKAFLPA